MIAVFAALALLGAAAGVGYGWWSTSRPAPSSPQAVDKVIRPASVVSIDPSGGSGLRHVGNQWRTQTYTTPTFGNLKDGVGLVLDLGSSRPVTSVTVAVTTTPIVLELRAAAGDSPAVADFQPASSPLTVPATGNATLSTTDAGSHRYWLVWITRLARHNGGYGAVIGEPVVRGR